MSVRETLSLDLGDRSYEIVIGENVLASLGARLKPMLKGRQIGLVTNETVAPLYAETVIRSLEEAGFQVTLVILPDGERYKNWETLNLIFDALIGAKFERQGAIVALGGGVVGDMAGYAAASLLRGVPYVQVPTTLLAQVDSSVGGKTGINHPLGKNLIGAFYQPKLVLMDLATLHTLPKRELLAGLAEVIKYGIIWDEALFQQLEEQLEPLLALDYGVLAKVVHRCCVIKAEVVAKDERETGVRALLNLGHTFGHAIENLAGYGENLHGEAVGMGMMMAAHMAYLRGMVDAALVARVRALIVRAGLPEFPAQRQPLAAYLDAMGRDKKVVAGKMRFVLPTGMGAAVVVDDVTDASLAQVLAPYASDVQN
ncbi:3-dehydroquinate synthase [Magnetococcus marinus MC-1]|uniref:3-dehydroquinate synthase n=1 Tax=Magnetococcus marinus (strain ATCC BAA-1437 / JCM 17883 / MC-1) TaxID=156889 RepID=A0LA26_MAGMM|nr:3-dehydroquinate synthase [Magnetococcus marinus]ABK44819.1 3-dehydroquinate synthase [Magnetococcus marinus MC-1]